MQADPGRDSDTIPRLVADTVRRYQTSCHAGAAQTLRDSSATTRSLWHAIAGYGPISDLLMRADVEEIFVDLNRFNVVGGRCPAQSQRVARSRGETLEGAAICHDDKHHRDNDDRRAVRRLAIIRHAEEVTGNVSRPPRRPRPDVVLGGGVSRDRRALLRCSAKRATRSVAGQLRRS